MSFHLHKLSGCTPTPLACYLKALGVLRLIAEQKDATARGFFRDDVFYLVTTLDEDALVRFFVEEYAPTPIVTPWNGGSGFYEGDNRDGLDALAATTHPRLEAFRRMISEASRLPGLPARGLTIKEIIDRVDRTVDTTSVGRKRAEILAELRAAIAAYDGDVLSNTIEQLQLAQGASGARDILKLAKKARTALKSDARAAGKLEIMSQLRATADMRALAWMDAAFVIDEDDFDCPSLLGTAGNEGRQDYGNKFASECAVALIHQSVEAGQLLRSALFGGVTRGLHVEAVGQLNPGRAGGPNMSAGFGADKAPTNAWDFVLALEGAVVFRAALVRHLDSDGPPHGAAPFAVRGIGSAVPGAGPASERLRGEQWLPIWNRAATLAEIQALFRDGRLQTGDSRARSAVDAARAVSQFGVARGVTELIRYAYVLRRGDSYVAVPAARWPVRRAPNIGLLDEIAPWVQRLGVAAARKGAPGALEHYRRCIEDALLEVSRDGGVGVRWERLLVALGEAEAAFVARRKATKELRLQPIPRLSAAWIAAAAGTNPSVELRLASAIASQVTPGDAQRRPAERLGTIRVHCLPLEVSAFTPRFATNGDGLASDPRVVWRGRDLVTDLSAVVERRLVDAAGAGLRGLGLGGLVPARMDDVDAFLAGRTDDGRIARLARALMAVDFSKSIALDSGAASWWEHPDHVRPLPAYALFRAVYASELPEGRDVRTLRADPAVVRQLVAGDLEGAAGHALERLRAMGARPKMRFIAGSAEFARRIAASLAIPLAMTDLGRVLDVVCKPVTEE